MSKGWLSTHVLDTALGRPAKGIRITLYRLSGNSHQKIVEMVTNEDGRTDQRMLDGEDFRVGTYELVFAAGDYLRQTGQVSGEVLFLDEVPIRFGISDSKAHYHVPLLLSAHGMATYRGS